MRTKLILSAVLAAGFQPAQATIVSTFSDIAAVTNWGNSYNPIGAYGANNYIDAFEFTAATTGTIDSIIGEMYLKSGANDITLGIYNTSTSASTGKDIVGTLVAGAQWNLSSQLSSAAGTFSYFNNLNGPTLTAGANYWLQAQITTGSTAYWYFLPTGTVSGATMYSTNGTPHYSYTASNFNAFGFQINVNDGNANTTPVPLPAAGILLASGLIGLGALRKKPA